MGLKIREAMKSPQEIEINIIYNLLEAEDVNQEVTGDVFGQ